MKRSPKDVYRIRLGKPEDALGIRRAQRQSWIYAYDHVVPKEVIRKKYKIKPESVERMKKAMREKENRYWVALKNEKVIGFCHAKKGNPSEIGAIYLMKSYWGKGLGQKLLNKAFKWLGDKEIIIWTEATNERAINFYEKNGFKKTKKKGTFFAKMLETEFKTIMMKKSVKK